jgi:hypothetical protein
VEPETPDESPCQAHQAEDEVSAPPQPRVTPPGWADADEHLVSRIHDLARMKRLDPAQMDWARGILLDAEQDATLRHEAAEALLRSDAPDLLKSFMKILARDNEDDRYRSWTVQHLGTLVERQADLQPKVEPALRRLLEDRSVLVQREALLALSRTDSDAAAPVAEAWLQPGQEPTRRDMAMRCALELDLRQTLPQIRRALDDPDPTNRIAAMLVLSSWGDAESRAAIAEATQSDRMRVRRAAEAALKRLDARGGDAAKAADTPPQTAPQSTATATEDQPAPSPGQGPQF